MARRNEQTDIGTGKAIVLILLACVAGVGSAILFLAEKAVNLVSGQDYNQHEGYIEEDET